MVQLNERFSELAKRVATLKNQLAREGGQLEALKRQKALIVQSCRERGVDPEKLDSVIVEREAELAEVLSKVENNLEEIERKRNDIIRNTSIETKTG